MKNINIKKIIALIGLFLLPVFCFATEPYPDQISTTSNKKTIVRLTTRIGSNIAVRIENDASETLKEFTDEEILLNEEHVYRIYSTAGSDWFQNSISIITYDDKYFAVWTRWGRIIVINLISKKLLQKMPPEVQEQIRTILIKKAIKLLSSQEPKDRQTGAIACGQLQIEESIPKLKELLQDENYYTTNLPKEWTRVYYVRKAAKTALEQMKESVDNIVIEEPDK